MRPRLTGGRLRGRPLPADVPSGVRPTSARVREALFSLVGHQLDGVRVLDAFGGTGLLGLEACSRGAEVVIVERNRRAAKQIECCAKALDVTPTIVQGDVLREVSRLGRFDVVLADPPYSLEPAPIVAGLACAVAEILVLEQPADRGPPVADALRLVKSRTYGGTALHVYAAPGEAR